MGSRKTYSREFKIEAVKLVTEQGMSRKQVARDLGIDVASLRGWIKQYSEAPEEAFPGKGHVRDEEVRKLKREVEELRMERDILKKAVGIFSQMPKK
jgi:transposase